MTLYKGENRRSYVLYVNAVKINWYKTNNSIGNIYKNFDDKGFM